MTKPKPKLIFVVTEDHYFYSHRLPMARAGQRAGYDVAVVTNAGTCRAAIEAEGIRVIPLSLERRSLSPFKALLHILCLSGIYRREKPALVHHIAMKPVLYGALAAWIAGVPGIVNAFAGMGYVFVSGDWRARLLRLPLLAAFRVLLRRRGSYLLLQNGDDLALLRRYGVVPEGRTGVIPGSGVDLERFAEKPFAPPGPDIVCAFAGRMIAIKGLATLKSAFALLAEEAPEVKLWLCGAPDPANPGSWTAEKIEDWVAGSDNVVYKGKCADMGAVWAQAHIALQPSDGGEGVPKALLEAAACGRAIVATDVPGCRDIVADGDNGFLVPPQNPRALADAIIKLARDPDRCRAMGRASRRRVEAGGFSEAAVAAQAEALYRAWPI